MLVPHLSGEQHGSVIVLWVPMAWWIEELLPGAKIPQSHTSVAGDLRADLLVLHYQHLHHHDVNGVLYAGMLVQLGCHGHQGQNVVLWRRRERTGQLFNSTSMHNELQITAKWLTIRQFRYFCIDTILV